MFVRPFPDLNSGRVQISTTDGHHPSWSRNGRELFYVSTAGRDAGAALMSVAVQPGDVWSAGTALKLFESPALLASDIEDSPYDASPDAQRFLVISAPAKQAATATPQRFVVVQNWFEELKRTLPAR